MPSDLIPSQVKQNLQKSLLRGGLAAAVNQFKKEKETFILLDCSSSMCGQCGNGQSKMSALSEVVNQLRGDGIKAQWVGFGGSSEVGYIVGDSLPNPDGGTPLMEAIQFCQLEHAEHVIVISDGEPNDRRGALQAAKILGKPIDVFYVGPRGGQGEQFLQELAKLTGGKGQTISLVEPKALTSGIKGLLGA